MNNIISVNTFQCFTKEQVKEINKEIKRCTNNGFSQKENPDEVAKFVTKKGDFFHIPCPPLMELLHPWLYQCQLINKNLFGYDIYWDFHLDFFKYNVYGVGGEYRWHVDATNKNAKYSGHVSSTKDTKLTCLLNLSEESYEGGEFHSMGNPNEEVKFTTGMGLVFTSLLAHKVTPVTKGERKTLTYWAEGPVWR